MKWIVKISLILATVSLPENVSATRQMDSLRQAVDTLQNDSLKIRTYRMGHRNYLYTDPDVFIEINREIMRICVPHFKTWDSTKTPFYAHEYAHSAGLIGLAYSFQGIHNKAMQWFELDLKVATYVQDFDEVCLSHNYLGYLHAQMNSYRLALQHLNDGKKIAAEMADHAAQIQFTTNIGATYQLIADSAMEVGNIELRIKYLDESERYFLESISLCTDPANQPSLVTALNNLASVERDRGNYILALELSEKALRIATERNEQIRISESEYHLASIHLELGNYNTAIELGLSSMDRASQGKNVQSMQRTAEILAQCYEEMGQSENALKYYEMHFNLEDTLNSEQNLRSVFQQEFRHDYEVATARDSLSHSLARQLKDAKIVSNEVLVKGERTGNFTLIGLFVGVFVLMIILLMGYVRKRRTHRIMKSQKYKVEESRKEILLSIGYAERIQNSVLPSDEEIRKYLPGFATYYSPCDIVSGDFYWFAHQQGSSYIALGDCTGHGVPGAFMSLIGSTTLKEIVLRSGISEPAEILEALDKKIKEILRQYDSNSTDEGMEIAVVKINHEKNELTFSGASQHLFLVGEKAEIIKADMRGIGGWVRKPEKLPKFTNQRISLDGVQSFFMTTDGLEDQFGVESDEKFGRRRILETISDKSNNSIVATLAKELTTWRGSERQTDDVCIIGVRLN